MFETTGILNEYVLRSVKKYVLPPKQKLTMIIMAMVLIVVGVGSYMVFENYIASSVSIVLGIYMLFQINKTAEKAIAMNIRNMRANCGSDACSYTTSFSDEGILVHNHATGAKVRYKYEGVVSIKESEILYAIFTKSHQMICVFKNDLNENPEELMAYLKTMPTQIKW
ncbi:MAG: YcxB family protein [Firmicutes bacterium]|nr:YcxB family protein [Bacillota bacterium]